MAGIFDPGIFDSGIFDDAASGSAVTRSTTDAPTTSDSVTRTLAGTRSATAAPTASDAATRGATLSRSATESIATAESVSTGAISRSATDAPTTSDAATRSLAAARTATDAPTAAGTATRAATFLRAATDAPTTSDVAVKSFALVRTTAESVSTADVATRLRNVGRSASEAVSATVAVTRSAVLTRHQTQSLTGADLALSVPIPYLPGPAIYIDGTNITKADGDPVLFASARFMSAVNGVAGEAHFRVRDDAGTTNYLPGQPLQLIINGQAAWTGFVTNVKRVYVFPALNVDDFGPTRFFDIDGTDLNILFTRRIVFDQAHPANVLAPLYGTFTSDVHAISDLLAGWLDLSGDGLDTSTDVHHVGDINEDQQARAWEGSDTWGQAMQSITALPASIYYIRPDRLLAYVDTDTPDAPFGLSDQPDGVTSKGYREMEVLFDGTNLANDVLAWGVGYGSNAPVFTRAQDATSESEHGRWQLGQTTFGVYKQATINRIADSILNGSPDHHRGAKDNRRAVTVTTYEPGLLPAQKVPFESAVFGYSEVLPIRKMEITFPAPGTPRYDLTLSQEIDVPWSFYDPYRLKLPGLPGIPKPTIPIIGDPGGCPPLCEQPTYRAGTDDYALTYPYVAGSLNVTLAGSPIVVTETDPGSGVFSYSTGDQSAGMVACYTVVFRFDNFNRTVVGGWGTSDFGLPWTTEFANHTAFSVDGSQGVAHLDGSFVGASGIQSVVGTGPWASDFTMTALLSAIRPNDMQQFEFSSWSSPAEFSLIVNLDGSSSYLNLTNTRTVDEFSPNFTFLADSSYYIKWQQRYAGTCAAKIWLAGTTEPDWMVTATGTAVTPTEFFISAGPAKFAPSGDMSLLLDWIDFDYTGKPCYQDCGGGGTGRATVDDFENRTISPGSQDWGTSSNGQTWTSGTGAAPSDLYVSAGAGAIVASNETTRVFQLAPQTGLGPGETFGVMRFGFRVDVLPGPTHGDNFTIQAYNGQEQVNVTIDTDAGTGGVFVFCGTGGTGGAGAFGDFVDWSANTDYWLKWEYDGSLSRATIWRASDPEPVSWLASRSATGDTPSGTPNFEIDWESARTTFPHSTDTLLVSDISISGGCTDVLPVTPGPLFGPWSENAVRVDATHYQLSRAIVPNSAFVWLDGFIAIAGTDFTEDDAAGQIVFTSPIDPAVTVTVGYTANGSHT